MSVKKSSRPKEVHTQGPLDRRDVIFTNLLLLGFDRSEMEGKFNVPFTKDMFAVPNKKCFEVVMHFLFEKLNPPMAQDRFRYCWPISDKKQEQAFRKVVNNWLTEIKEEEDCNLPRIVPSLFLSPGGDKFYTFLLHFSRYVIHRVILKEIGVKERDLLLYPQLPSKEAEFAEQVGRALEASCVRHRRSFLSHLHKDLLLQEQWSSYASELAGEYRRMGKEIRELEARIKQEEAHLMAQAKARGSPSVTRRRRSGALLDAEWDMMAVTRTQKVQKVREMWKSFAACHASQRQELEVVESILEGAANRYRVDGGDLRVQVPEMLLRECHKELEKGNIDNTYEGGKLNLISLIQLWNLSLRLYLEKLHQAPLSDYESIQPEIVTQVHTHHAHLTNLQALRSSMSQEVLPSIKSSIGTLKRHLELGHEPPTWQRAPNTNASHFLGDGLGLLPSTPPVSFEPASAAQAREDTPTRPMSKAFWKASPTVNTPEAVSSLVNNVNQAVYKQSHLMQGTPTSTLRLLREQINRPSRLPKPAPAKASQQKTDRRRNQSAPSRTQEQSQSEEENTLKLQSEDSIGMVSHHEKREVRTQPRKITSQSRTVSHQKTKTVKSQSVGSTRKLDKKTGSSKKDRSVSTPSNKSRTPVTSISQGDHMRTPANSRLHGDHTSTSVSRAHQDLIDQIADAVVGTVSGSPELTGSMESPLLSSSSHSESPVPLGIEDPLSVLDQSAFVTRDKLKHSPINIPSNKLPTSSLAWHQVSPQVQHSASNNNQIKLSQSIDAFSTTEPSHIKGQISNSSLKSFDKSESLEGDESESVDSLSLQRSSVKQRTSDGSQKSVTFSDHVDERNISAYSLGSDLNNSSMNGDVFASDGLMSSPSRQSLPELLHLTATGQTPDEKLPGKGDDLIAEGYLSPSPEHHKLNGKVELTSPLDRVFSLDEPSENGQDDLLLDSSDRLEDLLVHVSPLVTPSATPKLAGNRNRRYQQNLNNSSLIEDPFASSGTLSSPAVQTEMNLSHSVMSKSTPAESFATRSGGASGVAHQRTAPQHTRSNGLLSPTDRPFKLDNTFENGQDEFLLDTSNHLDDLLVHVSPLLSPSATPKLIGNRSRLRHQADSSLGSAPNSVTKESFHETPHLNDSSIYSVPANIPGLVLDDDSPFSANDSSFLKDVSNLRLRTPGTKTPMSSYKGSPSTQSPLLQTTPKTTIDFDLLDEDDSVLLPPSPYAPSPSSKSPSGAVGQLINI